MCVCVCVTKCETLLELALNYKAANDVATFIFALIDNPLIIAGGKTQSHHFYPLHTSSHVFFMSYFYLSVYEEGHFMLSVTIRQQLQLIPQKCDNIKTAIIEAIG